MRSFTFPVEILWSSFVLADNCLKMFLRHAESCRKFWTFAVYRMRCWVGLKGCFEMLMFKLQTDRATDRRAAVVGAAGSGYIRHNRMDISKESPPNLAIIHHRCKWSNYRAHCRVIVVLIMLIKFTLWKCECDHWRVEVVTTLSLSLHGTVWVRGRYAPAGDAVTRPLAPCAQRPIGVLAFFKGIAEWYRFNNPWQCEGISAALEP